MLEFLLLSTARFEWRHLWGIGIIGGIVIFTREAHRTAAAAAGAAKSSGGAASKVCRSDDDAERGFVRVAAASSSSSSAAAAAAARLPPWRAALRRALLGESYAASYVQQ